MAGAVLEFGGPAEVREMFPLLEELYRESDELEHQIKVLSPLALLARDPQRVPDALALAANDSESHWYYRLIRLRSESTVSPTSVGPATRTTSSTSCPEWDSVASGGWTSVRLLWSGELGRCALQS